MELEKLMTKLYKVRDINTGLFSTGGYYPGWTNKGKTWSGVGPLKSHLNFHKKKGKIGNWEVVVYEVFESAKISIADVEYLKK
jgi:hypothetical protein